MPTYEYTCKNCGENIEVFQSFSAKPLKKHDACGGNLQKVFHSRGVVFKGSGWYTKDSKPNGAPASQSGGESDTASKPKEKAVASAAKEKSAKDLPAKTSKDKDSSD